MRARIFLIHPYFPTMGPIDAAFKQDWPEAEILNVLDESLYADVPADGTLSPALFERVAGILRHCEKSRADGIVFTGTTFGPAIEAARREMKTPVLRAEEAMAEEAVKRGKRILLVCTAQRAMPVVRESLEKAAGYQGLSPKITDLWVKGAKSAIVEGTMEPHDRMIAREIEAAGERFDVIVLGQISMVPARAYIAPEIVSRVIASPEAAVARMRALVGG
jgi:Asp/Glu/hydantoin racemase